MVTAIQVFQKAMIPFGLFSAAKCHYNAGTKQFERLEPFISFHLMQEPLFVDCCGNDRIAARSGSKCIVGQ